MEKDGFYMDSRLFFLVGTFSLAFNMTRAGACSANRFCCPLANFRPSLGILHVPPLVR